MIHSIGMLTIQTLKMLVSSQFHLCDAVNETLYNNVSPNQKATKFVCYSPLLLRKNIFSNKLWLHTCLQLFYVSAFMLCSFKKKLYETGDWIAFNGISSPENSHWACEQSLLRAFFDQHKIDLSLMWLEIICSSL